MEFFCLLCSSAEWKFQRTFSTINKPSARRREKWKVAHGKVTKSVAFRVAFWFDQIPESFFCANRARRVGRAENQSIAGEKVKNREKKTFIFYKYLEFSVRKALAVWRRLNEIQLRCGPSELNIRRIKSRTGKKVCFLNTIKSFQFLSCAVAREVQKEFSTLEKQDSRQAKISQSRKISERGEETF